MDSEGATVGILFVGVNYRIANPRDWSKRGQTTSLGCVPPTWRSADRGQLVEGDIGGLQGAVLGIMFAIPSGWEISLHIHIGAIQEARHRATKSSTVANSRSGVTSVVGCAARN